MTAFDDKPLPPIRGQPGPGPMLPLGLHPVDSHMRSGTGTASGRNTPQDFMEQRPRKTSSKMSLFSLFSRPKVERLRGYAEPGLDLSPLEKSTSRSASPDSRLRQTLSLNRSQPATPRSGTGVSFREGDFTGSPRDDRGAERGLTRQTRRDNNNFVPPPLFQAYAQSVKACKAQSVDGFALLQASRRRRDSHDLTFRIDKPHRNGSIGAIQHTNLPKKIFALTTSGHLLQYADQGTSERLPEKVLQLGKESVACACDLVPGEPFVLQVARTTAAMEAAPASISLFSKMGLRSSRTEATHLLLVLRDAQELDEWLVAVRKKIQGLGGNASQVASAPGIDVAGIDSSPETSEHALREPNFFRLPQGHSPSTVLEVEEIAPHESIKADASGETAQGLSHSIASSALSPVEATSMVSPVISSTRQSLELRPRSSKASMNSATPRDSPMAGPMDSGIGGAEPMQKHFPFKIKPTIPEGMTHPPHQPAREDSSPTGSNTATALEKPLAIVSEADKVSVAQDYGGIRPDSIITELPSFRMARAADHAVTTPYTISRRAVDVKHMDPRLKPLRTSDPNNPRRPTIKPFTVPLKINTAGQSKDESDLIESPIVKSVEGSSTWKHHPHRTPSVKLSLFPAAAPGVYNPTRPTRSATVTKEPSRSLRRPASLQVHSDPVPFLSSVRVGSSGTGSGSGNGNGSSGFNHPSRLAVHPSGSVPSLRSASAMASSPTNDSNVRMERVSSEYKFTTPTSNLVGNAFLHPGVANTTAPRSSASSMRSASPGPRPKTPIRERSNMTALPPLPALPPPSRKLPRQGHFSGRAGSKTRSESPGLPALDLGIPVIGLAPPAPPPTRGLPSLPNPPPVPSKAGVKVH
ncbi:hypothetical protein AAFC00_002344 [Neodothiora populina]|uniref:PH domain-containing protein n=1 Tax=Neodothiora populina TaxID=2781224 RepID=A0ABR3PHC4_9PEZI